jgi:hypothetical protein
MIKYFLNKYKNDIIYLFIMNIDCEIIEENSDNDAIGYNEIINLVDISIEQKVNLENSDKMMALTIFYNENYTKKYLEKIAEYYDISKRKKRKSQLIKNIVQFECNQKNDFVVERRRTLWFYLEELENDNKMSKYVIFN